VPRQVPWQRVRAAEGLVATFSSSEQKRSVALSNTVVAVLCFHKVNDFSPEADFLFDFGE
jgi:hypothetical protein